MDVHCEWGRHGLETSLRTSDVIVIVDVLSFSTAVTVATARGAKIYPIDEKDAAAAFAEELGAELAGPRGTARYSLSPASFLDVLADTRIVLPSPNGARLSALAAGGRVFAGCLRNATAVARAAAERADSVAVIPAGERWEDGSLRPALEDWLGAGAIIAALGGAPSAEAEAADATFRGVHRRLREAMLGCRSGQELVAWGFEQDVLLAADLDATDCVPELVDRAYVRVA